MRRRGYLAGWTATVLLCPAVASAQSIEILGPPAPTGREVVSWDAEGRATARATRASEPMSIDGVLDEPFYRSTASIPNLKQSLPTLGAEPAERIETWIGFDDNNVYSRRATLGLSTGERVDRERDAARCEHDPDE